MRKNTKLILCILFALIFIGLAIFNFITDGTVYRFIKTIGVIALVGYIIYHLITKGKETDA